jgi:hypothetical protein
MKTELLPFHPSETQLNCLRGEIERYLEILEATVFVSATIIWFLGQLQSLAALVRVVHGTQVPYPEIDR